MLNDSAFDLESYFRSEFARRISNAEEIAFLTGDGKGKPTGLFSDTEGADVGITAASATAITADEIMNLYYSLRAPYRKNAVWLMNDATVNAIRLLKDKNGQYLWQPALKDGTYDTLLGRPVYTSNAVPTIGAGAKVMAFGDLSYYWIGDREGITFRRLNELYAAKGQIGFLATKRVEIGVSINTVKSFCRRNGMCTSRGNRCIYCGGIITQLPGTKKRVFCSDKCKQTYWNKMRTTRVSKNKLPHQCPVCGEIFYDYSSSKRTYCSQECYHKRNSICTELSD